MEKHVSTRSGTFLFPGDWLDEEIEAVLREEQDALDRQQKAEALGEMKQSVSVKSLDNGLLIIDTTEALKLCLTKEVKT